MPLPSPFRTLVIVSEGVHLTAYGVDKWELYTLTPSLGLWVEWAVLLIFTRYAIMHVVPLVCWTLGTVLINAGNGILRVGNMQAWFIAAGDYFSEKAANGLDAVVRYLRRPKT